MTLLIGYVDSRRAAYLASDRRFSFPDGSIDDDNGNKFVFYDFRVGFGFTGLVEVEGQTTSRWLASALAEAGQQDLSRVSETVALLATEAFDRPWIRRVPPLQRWLTVVGVGWARAERSGLAGLILKISNLESSGGIVRQFSVKAQLLKPDSLRTGVIVAGRPLTSRTQQQLASGLKHLRRHGSSDDQYLRHLVKTVRAASKHDVHIGRRASTIVIPRESVNSDAEYRFVPVGYPNASGSTPSFRYWEDGFWNGITYGPTFVMPDGSIADNFKSGPSLPELGGWVDHSEREGNGFTVEYPLAVLFWPNGRSVVIGLDESTISLVAYSSRELLSEALDHEFRHATPVFVNNIFELWEVLEPLDLTTYVALDPDPRRLSPARLISREEVEVRRTKRSEWG